MKHRLPQSPRHRPRVETLEGRRLCHAALDVTFNFQPYNAPVPDGTIADVGAKFGPQDDGFSHGWNRADRANLRDRNKVADQRLDTVAFMQPAGKKAWWWEVALPDGDYQVTITSGDAKYLDGDHRITAEGILVMNGRQSAKKRFLKGTQTVTVADGRLTLKTAYGAVNTKINSVRIVAVHPDGPDETPTPVELSTVTATTTAGTATEGGSAGHVRLSRSAGDLSASLTVALDWTGAADVDARPTSATFAAGASTIDLPVVATDDDAVEADETATVAIVADASSYTLGTPASASVTIVSDDVAPDPDPPTQSDAFTNITWSGTVAPPASYTETTGATVNGKIYLFGGFTGAFVPQKSVYRFDGRDWQTMNNSPQALTHTASAVDGNDVWFVGGYVGKDAGGQTFGTAGVAIYHGATDTWTTGPALPQARASGNLVRVGRVLYYFGGENLNRTATVGDAWSLNLDDASAGWQSRAAMPLPRSFATAANVDGRIIVLGGHVGYDANLVAKSDIQIYDPAANAWSVATQKLPDVRSYTINSSQYYRGRILMVTGEVAHNQPVNTVWSIDPSTLATSVLGTFPDARLSAASGILNDKLYLFGGYKGSIATASYAGTFV